jgi:hypothetical protein
MWIVSSVTMAPSGSSKQEHAERVERKYEEGFVAGMGRANRRER